MLSTSPPVASTTAALGANPPGGRGRVRPYGAGRRPPGTAAARSNRMATPDRASPRSASPIGRRTVWRVLRRFAFLVGLGLLAGLVAGAVAGGVGARVAMRVVALVAGHNRDGQLTDADAVVGQITLEGTLFLLGAGAYLGLPGGLLYVAVRRWLPGAGIRKGLAFGGLLLLLFGSLIIDGDNPDFRRFGLA